MSPAITGLYVPGDRPDRFDKAVACGADLVILDLEDAVAPAAKPAARTAVVAWLAEHRSIPVDIEVRVNADAGEDVAALRDAPAGFAVRVPKVESPADLDRLASVLPGVELSALIETARGVETLGAIAAHPSLRSIGLGEADLASDLGSRDDVVLDYARSRLVYAARANGLAAPMMSVYPAIADLDGLRVATERGRARGFVGRTAIHPSQLPVIRSAFRPSEAEVAWATEVVAAVGDGGVTTLGSGEMVDAAMVELARTTLALAHATRPPIEG